MELQHNKILQGSIPKQLLAFFFPIWMGTFFQFLYNTADAAIVGHQLGKQALSAVGGPTASVINLLVNFFVGLASGATVVISQYYGAHDANRCSRAVHTSIALSLVGGVLLMLGGIFLSPSILRAMGTPDDILPLSVVYIRIYFAGIIPNVLYNIGSGILRAIGDSKRPLYFLIVCSLSNVALDFLFVVGFGWGVAGAALATIFSQFISAVLVIAVLCRSPEMFRLHPSRIRFDFHILERIVCIGLPAGLQSVMYGVSNLIIQASINSFGTNAVAAWTAYGKIDGFFWMTVSSFGIAITTFAGQNFGARQYARLKKSVAVCLGLCAGFTAVLSLGLMLFGAQLYRVFTADSAVIAIGIRMMECMVPFYLTYIAIEILSGAVRGAGDAIVPMLLTCFGICVLRVVWISVAVPMHRTIETVCMSYPITWTVTSVLFAAYFLQGGWLKRCIAKAGHKAAEQPQAPCAKAALEGDPPAGH